MLHTGFMAPSHHEFLRPLPRASRRSYPAEDPLAPLLPQRYNYAMCTLERHCLQHLQISVGRLPSECTVSGTKAANSSQMASVGTDGR